MVETSGEKRKRVSFKWNVFAYLLGFCALLLAILWLFQTVLLDSFYKRVKVMEIRSAVEIIESAVKGGERDLTELLSSFSDSKEMYIELMYENEDSIALTDEKRDAIFPQDSMALIEKAKENDGEYYDYFTVDELSPDKNKPPQGADEQTERPQPKQPQNHRKIESLAFVKVIETEDARPVIVLVNAQISPVDATVNTLRYQLYVITGVMVALAIVIALIIAKKVSKPLEALSGGAKQLAHGNYDVAFNGKGFLEIEELSDTLNAAAKELGRTDELRRELVANVSHDLRTPLALIYGCAEVMHDFPDEVTPEQTETIMAEVKRLSSLVNDVLDISKLESGGEKLSIAPFDIAASFGTVTERMAKLLSGENYRIAFDAPKELCVRADEGKLTQAFYNLLTNAVNYTGEDKCVLVRVLDCGSTVRVEVRDTGCGVAKEDMPFIWDRYYKLNNTHRRAVTGTGLGLSIVRRVVELHGGNYGVDSHEKMGSTFWFSIQK